MAAPGKCSLWCGHQEISSLYNNQNGPDGDESRYLLSINVWLHNFQWFKLSLWCTLFLPFWIMLHSVLSSCIIYLQWRREKHQSRVCIKENTTTTGLDSPVILINGFLTLSSMLNPNVTLWNSAKDGQLILYWSYWNEIRTTEMKSNEVQNRMSVPSQRLI